MQLNADNRHVELVYAPAPEPATLGLLILGDLTMAGAAARRRG
ncbi:MAG: hypothetical protein BIFFINMI_01571 [Phycisphaerae bacterium]|nr:hypothetical protein [Phycisphaerae bacterium]